MADDKLSRRVLKEQASELREHARTVRQMCAIMERVAGDLVGDAATADADTLPAAKNSACEIFAFLQQQVENESRDLQSLVGLMCGRTE